MKQKGSFLVGRQIKSGALKKMDSTMRQWVLSRQLSSLKEGIMLVCFFSIELYEFFTYLHESEK